jgi:hypothetical protein
LVAAGVELPQMLMCEWRECLPHVLCLAYDAGDSSAARVAQQAAQRQAKGLPEALVSSRRLDDTHVLGDALLPLVGDEGHLFQYNRGFTLPCFRRCGMLWTLRRWWRMTLPCLFAQVKG